MRAAAAILRREEVESVAVCLLHAYVNPAHEQRVGAILAEELPGVPVSLSAEVAPEFREYQRASTTVINAVIRPVVERYLERIESRSPTRGVQAKLLVMQSSGGVFSSEAARDAARVHGRVRPGGRRDRRRLPRRRRSAARDIISFDMGGTTAKVGLIQDGQPSVTKDYEVGGHGGRRDRRHVAAPATRCGRRSSTWSRSAPAAARSPGSTRAALLRVGPQSAGADPGPVCYGRGGTEPTVTDANVVLGRLEPELLPRRRDRPRRRGRAARDRGALREAARPRRHRGRERDRRDRERGDGRTRSHLISVQRGYDPRDFVLVGFGGAGPVHANALARDAEMPTLLIPRSPGIFSATGLLTTDLKRDTAVTVMRRLDDLDAAEVETTFAELEAAGRAELEREGLAADAMSFVRKIDLRYVGQSYELTIPAGDDLLERFHAEHDRTYGFSAPEEPVEVVSLRLTSVGTIAKPPPRPLDTGGRTPSRRSTAASTSPSRTATSTARSTTATRCPAGATFDGPAVVEEFDSTTVVHPGFTARVDDIGNLRHREGRHELRDRRLEGRDGADAGRHPPGDRPLPARAATASWSPAATRRSSA